MLEKIAAVANFADKQGEHDLAGDLTQIIKSAQLLDAMKVLFDPDLGGMDKSAPFWKRLQRGWQRGKFDRRLGNALAINADRTKWNQRIQNMAKPLKEFVDQANALYDKVLKGAENYTSVDFSDELSKLKSQATRMKKLLGRDLRKALDQRNKLNAQQIKAIESIKGVNEDQKGMLLKLLMGEEFAKPTATEEKPAAAKTEEVPGAPAAGAIKGVSPEEHKAIKEWLATLPFPKMRVHEGLTHKRSKGLADTIFSRWGQSPMALKTFFESNGDQYEEGLKRFGKPFRKVLKDANDVLDLENQFATPATKEEAPKAAPPKAETPKAPEAPKAPAAATIPLVQGLSPEGLPPDVQERVDTARKIEKMRAGKGEAKPKKPTLPEETIKNPGAAARKGASLADSASARLEREITRLGRMQQLRKLAENIDLEPLDDGLKPIEEEFIGLEPHEEDVYMIPEGRLESFDEESHPDKDELEYYKGRKDDEDYYDTDTQDIRLLGTDPDLEPDDDDYVPGRDEPKLAPASTEEELADIVSLISILDRRIERLKDEGGSEDRLDRLETRRDELVKRRDSLSPLPVGWANDADDLSKLAGDVIQFPLQNAVSPQPSQLKKKILI